MAAGTGLTTPEFAVLLAYTKIGVYQDLLASDIPEDPYLGQALPAYFPAALHERFPDHFERHPLRREIIATVVANNVVNRAGTSFVFRMSEETGAATADIVRAHRVASDVFAIGRSHRRDRGLRTSDQRESTQVTMVLEARKLVERATRWLLRNRRSPLDIDATVSLLPLRASRRWPSTCPTWSSAADRDELKLVADGLVEDDVPPDLAAKVAGLNTAFSGLDIVEVAQALKRPVVQQVADVYFQLGDWLDLDWLRDRIVALPRDDRWQALARAALRDDLYQEHAALTADVLRVGDADADPRALVDRWIEQNRAVVQRFAALLDDIKSASSSTSPP